MQLIKSSVCSSTFAKMFPRLSENRGRNISRERFHGAESCVSQKGCKGLPASTEAVRCHLKILGIHPSLVCIVFPIVLPEKLEDKMVSIFSSSMVSKLFEPKILCWNVGPVSLKNLTNQLSTCFSSCTRNASMTMSSASGHL